MQSPRLISADRASSCNPHGRGLDAQPWIPGPEVCTTPDLWPAVCTIMDPRAGSLHNPGFKASSMQTSAYIWRTSANQGQQLRSPAGRLAVRSSDQRRPGQQLQSPREGTRCTTMDPRAGSLHNPGSNGRKYEVCRRLQTFGERLQTKASSCDPLRAGTRCSPLDGYQGDLFAVPSSDQRRPGQQLRSPAGRLAVRSSDQRRPGQQLQSPREGTRCTTLDSRAGSLHNPGSNGRKYEVCRRLQTFGERLQTKPSSCDPLRAGWQFDRVINAGPVCSCGPVLDAVPSIDTRGTYLQFPRVINADRASSCDPLRAGWQFDLVINAGPVLDAVPSIDQRRPGQQYAQPWIHGPAVCTTLDPWGPGWNPIELSTPRRFAAAIPCGPVGVRSSDQRRAGTRCSPLDGSMGTYLQFPRVISADRSSSCDPHGRGLDAQPWIQWPEVCTTPDPMAESMHNHGSQGRKYADVCKHLENVCKPRPAAAIPCGPVGSSI
jgi:hypothetical protein